MHLMRNYFVDCIVDQIPRDRWTASAHVSRPNDWKKPAPVPVVVFATFVDCSTRRDAERAALQWARECVLASPDIIEQALAGRRQVCE